MIRKMRGTKILVFVSFICFCMVNSVYSDEKEDAAAAKEKADEKEDAAAAKEKADAAKADAANALVNGVNQSSKKTEEELKHNFDKISKKPESLISGTEGAGALAALVASGAKQISFQRFQGFNGVDEFEPSGWQVEVGKEPAAAKPESEEENATFWPMGVGMALMNGCFGSGYQKGDPCFAVARTVTRCINQIDAANFIGVGFDGRGYYSSESRKKSLIQRVCAAKSSFMGKDVPDIMNAFGVYDYEVKTETFQDAKQYIKYLQEKAATSQQDSMFHMEAESLDESRSTGGNLGVIGAVAGAAVGAYAGGATGAKMGASVGQALGQSIGFNVGSASGSSSNDQNGELHKSASSSQSVNKQFQNKVNMIAVLEANMKLFEIALDELKPDDLSTAFYADMINLPTSYFQSGAASVFQNFILRWGTHYVKSAKFGGEFKIMKTSKKESKLNTEQFAEAAQSEFSGMMSTLKSSYEQSSSGFSIFGIGTKKQKTEQKASSENTQESESKISQEAGGEQKISRSEFIKTTIQVQGGDPSIGAAITDFYTPRFRETLMKWLKTIDEFARPYEFTLGKVSQLLDMSTDSLFKKKTSEVGCFGSNLTKDEDSGKVYFTRLIEKWDAQNNTIKSIERNYCKYGNSRTKFVRDLSSIKLALERAENIYMAEGSFSTTNFDIIGGRTGCEYKSLDFVTTDDKMLKTWPKWDQMFTKPFKVLFNMQKDLPYISKDAEFIVKYYDGLWWTKKTSGSYSMAATCPASKDKSKKSICIAGVPFVYSEDDGFIKLDVLTYNKFKVSVPFWLGRPLAKAEQLKMSSNEKIQMGSIGLVPCNPKWSNTHQMDIKENATCMYFQAASAGSLYVIFSSLPSNYKSWYYLRISPNGISFYEAMKVKKVDISVTLGSLGSENLYEAYFVCLKRDSQNLKVQYGKSTKDSEMGLVYASYDYENVADFTTLFYAFASGEKRVSISDLRIVNGQPKMKCKNGLLAANGQCNLLCDTQCDGCHQSLDPKSCKSCKNFTFKTSKDAFICIQNCPTGSYANGKSCMCKIGFSLRSFNGKTVCSKCPTGTKGDGQICEDCPTNTYSNSDQSGCLQCPKGQRSAKKSSKCENDPCEPDLCKNGGKCISSFGQSAYKCGCLPGFGGKHCETCDVNRCKNGGTCKFENKAWICSCRGHYTGPLCEERTCYTSGQRGYTGTKDRTRSGLKCQRWDYNSPHPRWHAIERYPHNYCRNADDDIPWSSGPWCYTTSSSKRWESCGIPRC